MTKIRVIAPNSLRFQGETYRCAVGKGGFSAEKREGDGATPMGEFPLREVFYRPDRMDPPSTGLPCTALAPDRGWCDDPGDAAYNRPVRLPYEASHEALWRADGLYDLIAVIGYNDDPPRPGRGSAIFLHVARDDFAPTEGCVAVRLPDLQTILKACDPGTMIEIRPES